MKQCFLTTNGPKAIGPYSTAVICGNTAYLSGMIPADPATGKIVVCPRPENDRVPHRPWGFCRGQRHL